MGRPACRRGKCRACATFGADIKRCVGSKSDPESLLGAWRAARPESRAGQRHSHSATSKRTLSPKCVGADVFGNGGGRQVGEANSSDTRNLKGGALFLLLHLAPSYGRNRNASTSTHLAAGSLLQIPNTFGICPDKVGARHQTAASRLGLVSSEPPARPIKSCACA